MYFHAATKNKLKVELGEADPNRTQIPVLEASFASVIWWEFKRTDDARWDGAGKALGRLAVSSELLATAQPASDSLFHRSPPSFPPETWNHSALCALACFPGCFPHSSRAKYCPNVSHIPVFIVYSIKVSLK